MRDGKGRILKRWWKARHENEKYVEQIKDKEKMVLSTGKEQGSFHFFNGGVIIPYKK